MGKQKGNKKATDNKDVENSDNEIETNDFIETNKKKAPRFNLLNLGDEDDDVDHGDDDEDLNVTGDDDDDQEEVKVEVKPVKNEKKSKKKQNKIEEENDELGEVINEIEKEDKSKAKNKKSKKDKRKKKDGDDDEELDAMLAELALEIEGKKEPSKIFETLSKDDEKKDTDKDKGKKKKKAADKKDNEVQANQQPMEQVLEEKKDDEKITKEKGKKKKHKQAETVENEANVEKAKDETSIPLTKEGETEETKEGEDGEEKSKSKKGKKDAKGKDVKKPGKKQIAAMQEALKKIQEEEERLQREEEERIKREEEIERQRLENERLEKEKKDKKKQKEKDRKERMKKEGKLLTAKQKADQLRAKASLELLQQQGRILVGKDKLKRGDSDDKEKTPTENKVNLNDNKEMISDNKVAENHKVSKKEQIVETWEELTDSNDKNIEQSKRLKKDSTSESTDKPEPPKLRSPIICVLGHVDTGKTKLLDYLRKTHVQDNEAGGITQQIGATYVPPSAINDQCRNVKKPCQLSLPGLLIIDTPGHESFTNLRSRGSSLCDIAILVIDIMHGIEPQTLESINLLKARKTPFIVALNKIDRIYDWRTSKRDVEDVVRSQTTNTKLEFEQRVKETILQLNEQGLNAALFYENTDPRTYVSLIPTSAVVGDGMGNLINIIVQYTQTMMVKKLTFIPDTLEASVLEVKAIPGLGTTIDVILVNGFLKEGDKIVLAGHDGPIVTHIRSLLVPQPLRELRVKSPYRELKIVYGSMGVKIAGHDLEKAVAGLELYVAHNDTEVETAKEDCWKRFGQAMKSIKCSDKGVYVQASTLGSLEALLEFLKVSKIPYCGIRIGPVVKRDVMRASIMLEIAKDFAVILAFDVKVERDAQELADHLGVKIFTAEIIYHLFDKFTAYREDLKNKRKEQYKNLAVFPCKLRILPQFIFNSRDPIVVGVSVEDGIVVPGTPIAVPSKGNIEIGRVTTIELNHKAVDSARKGQEVCIKIEHCGGDAPKLYGRHFDHEDLLMSRVTRESINALKEYFRDDMQKSDWALIIELKKLFEIL